uniref:Uncharacterized protein LOC111137328 n=1 Tax=Crassostrea virginica TaxID=6565 RepID=A0A8B8EY21_CRAVI|nr:uncharacterized protein LOC111137328 [Crassostrea virginica]
MKHGVGLDFLSISRVFLLGIVVNVILGCQVQFYDIPGRRYHISKAYDQVTRSLDECRKRCARDDNCWALMHYNTSNLCALTNLTVIFGYGCDYCFSARKGNCIQPTTTATTMTTTESESTLCTCTCEDSTVDNITKLNERIASLKLPKTTLSMTRRKLTSADDQRPSARGAGAVGVFVLVTFLAVIILFDLSRFCSRSKE